MNLQFYIEKLKNSEEFKKFKKENPEAYFCSGFFIIDYEGKRQGDKTHLDFFIPENNKIFSFQLENNCKKVDVDQIPENKSEKISESLEIDLNKIEEIIKNKLQEENEKKEIQKILLSLQNVNNKNYLIGTIFITGLGMIKTKIDLETKKIIDYEKKSFMDMINIFKKDNRK